MPARRTSTLSVCLVAAAATVALQRQGTQPAAWVVSSRAANFAGRTLPAPASGRDGVEMRFFDKIQEALGLKQDPESAAASTLKGLTSNAKSQATTDQKDLKKAREGARAAMKSVSAAMATLRTAKDKAMDECEVEWSSDEAKWDASLKECAAPVLASANDAKKALEELKTANAELLSVCDRTEANVANRTKTAEAAVADLDAEARERLADKVKQASQPISEGAALRMWAMSKADLVDLEREIAASTGETTIDEAVLVSTLREKRSARMVAEKEAAAKAAAAAAAAKAKSEAAAAAATSSSSSAAAAEPEQEEGNPAALLGLVAILGVATFAFSKGQLPDLKAIKAPSMATISMPSMPSMPSMKPSVGEPMELPREAETKNKKEDLEVKVEKGELLQELK